MKPMLAAATDGLNLNLPMLASAKLDGVRCVIVDGVAMSRSLKPIPNQHVQHLFGCQELMHNANEAVVNELGQKERSSKKSGMVGKACLGALHVEDLSTKVRFDIGTGFTQAQRQDLWNRRASLVGQLVKYKSQPVGVKDKPRFPVFLGFRDERDR